MRVLINWFITTVAILIGAYLLPGVAVRGIGAAGPGPWSDPTVKTVP